ncbi:unnamed protein product [Timema podura]|uniref:Uncharacterized protein n=1 Tax=Timema podura TaxID=61482 RepID=A0ABN7NRF1_TIMPD|nr:unnamed protein product [Timema podura]
MASSKSFIKANSQTELACQHTERRLDRLESLRGSVSDVMAEDTFGPLSNVRPMGDSRDHNSVKTTSVQEELSGLIGGPLSSVTTNQVLHLTPSSPPPFPVLTALAL